MRKMKISMGLAAIAGLGYAADVLVDLAVDPPEATSPEGMVVGAERTRDGVALSLERPEDSEFRFMWRDPVDEVPGDDFFWRASALGVPLMYGSGLEVPLSDCPLADELEFMVPGSDADWTGLDKASSPMARQAPADRGGFVDAGSKVPASTGQPRGTRSVITDFGEFTYKVTIEEPDPLDFSLFGVYAPGGIVDRMPGLPECDGTGTFYSNVVTVVATGGRFTPRRNGTCTVSCSSDDVGEIHVGDELVARSTLHSDGTASAPLNGGQTYPVWASFSSIGGPYSFQATVSFEETPAEPVYNPHLEIANSVVKFSLKQDQATLSGKSHDVRIAGRLNPTNTYAIACETPHDGLDVTPDEDGNERISVNGDSPAWFQSGGAGLIEVYYLLYENGAVIDRRRAYYETDAEQERKKTACGCRAEGTKVEDESVSFSQVFGRSPWVPGLPVGALRIKQTYPSSLLGSPAALFYDHPVRRRVLSRRGLSATIADDSGETTEYKDGFPSGVSSGWDSQVYVNSGGEFVEVLPDRTQVVFNDIGDRVAAIVTPDGARVPAEELGIDCMFDGSGVLTNVTSVADGSMSVETCETNSWRVVWRNASGAFVKSFTFVQSNMYAFAMHEYRDEQFNFDYLWTYDTAAKDWVLDRGVGTDAAIREVKEISWDTNLVAWAVVTKKVDSTGESVVAESSMLDTDKGVGTTLSRSVGTQSLYSAERDPASGRLASESRIGEAPISYQYDQYGRLVLETTVRNGMTNVVERMYPALSAMLDRRPTNVVERLDGVVVRETAYEYSTNYVRTVRSFGGASRMSLREFDALGRDVLSVSEDGKAVASAYSGPGGDFSWTRTDDTGVWTEASGFSTVDGKSERTISCYNASGDMVRRDSLALVGGEWREVSWATHAYNATHNVIASSYSDGTSDSAAWICTGPVYSAGRDGIVVSNSYNSVKALVSSSRHSPLGAVTTTYTYDPAGRVVAETVTSEGLCPQTASKTYDARGRVSSETDAQGRTVTYAFSADDLVTTVTNPDGGTRVTTLNPDGSLASVTGTAVTPEYYSYGVTTTGLEWTQVNYLSPNGARWTRTYRSGFGETVREERPGANGSTLVTEYSYDEKGRLVATVSTGQPAETRTYDSWGDLASVVRAADGESRTQSVESANALVDGEVWRVESSALSSSDQSIAPLVTTNMTQVSGLSVSNESYQVAIDGRGNASETWSTFDPVTSARRTWRTMPEATNVAYEETVDGVATLSVSHSSVTNSATYDAYRRIVTTTDGRGNATTNAYDSLGRLASVTDATGATTSYAYDAAGRLAAVTNALGVATVYEYDVRGNKTYEGGGTYPVTFAYDAFNVMTNMTTYRAEGVQEGDTTSWEYDEATGLLLSKTYADGYGPSYTYTDSGELATRTWARGIVTIYAYDGWNNLTNTVYSDGTPSISLSYDAMGRQVSATDAAGTTTTSYDAFGDIVSETTSGLYSRIVSHFRDNYGRDLGLAIGNSRMSIIEYEADTARMKRVKMAGAWFTYYYLPGTDLKSRLQYGGSGSAYYTYEPYRDLLTQVRNHINGGVISQYDYVNDAAGRRTAITRSGSMMSETRTDAYGYNDRNELTNAVKNATLNEYAYQYDDIGNRLSSLDLGTNRTYTANALNQYTNIVEGAGGFLPEFDLDGNQTLVKTVTGVWSVTYNGENRPVLWECGSTNIVMKFDRMGRRVEYIETVSGVTNIHHRFVYDGYLCIQRLNGANNNSIDLVFGWDPSESIATRPLVLQKYGQYSMFYTHDGNKNVSDLVFFQQANGIAAHYEYAPFGAVTAASRSTPVTAYDFREYNPFSFSSEYADNSLGLVYYNYRHFSNLTARWNTREPYNGGFHLYAFVENDCINAIDCSGLRLVHVNNAWGRIPPNGWENAGWTAQTGITKDATLSVTRINCGSNGMIRFHASLDDMVVETWYRMRPSPQLIRDEMQHVDCFRIAYNSMEHAKDAINDIMCNCPDIANAILNRFLAMVTNAQLQCIRCNAELDKPGGPHLH